MNIVYLLGIVLAFVFVIFGITFDPRGTGGLMVGPFNLEFVNVTHSIPD